MRNEDVHDLVAPYALDALDEDERRRFERHLEGCERCAADLEELREAATALAYGAAGPPPPPALRERILTAARSERTNVVPLRRRFLLPATAVAAAAAACAAIGLGLWANSLRDSLDDERTARRQEERALVELLSEPGVEQIRLSGADGTLLVGSDRDAALLLENLGPAPEDHDYHAWVIEAGRPRPAGRFTAGQRRLVFMLTRPVPRGAIVAVTVERTGQVIVKPGKPIFSAHAA
jgi:anti-sigma-K factor RskA